MSAMLPVIVIAALLYHLFLWITWYYFNLTRLSNILPYVQTQVHVFVYRRYVQGPEHVIRDLVCGCTHVVMHLVAQSP